MSKEKKYYKNECPFDGEQDIVVMDHMGGCPIPRKCDSCQHNEEGECNLLTNPYKRLDFASCGVEGDSCLVEYAGAIYPIPYKCIGCKYLFQIPKIPRIVFCTKDKPDGCDFGRGLDYGDHS